MTDYMKTISSWALPWFWFALESLLGFVSSKCCYKQYIIPMISFSQRFETSHTASSPISPWSQKFFTKLTFLFQSNFGADFIPHISNIVVSCMIVAAGCYIYSAADFYAHQFTMERRLHFNSTNLTWVMSHDLYHISYMEYMVWPWRFKMERVSGRTVLHV